MSLRRKCSRCGKPKSIGRPFEKGETICVPCRLQATIVEPVLRRSAPSNPQTAVSTQPGLLAGSSLQVGASGPTVKHWQHALNAHHIPRIRLREDGIFGPSTKAATMYFQYRHGLLRDGIVSMETWLKMIELDLDIEPPEPSTPPRPFDERAAVSELTEILRRRPSEAHRDGDSFRSRDA